MNKKFEQNINIPLEDNRRLKLTPRRVSGRNWGFGVTIYLQKRFFFFFWRTLATWSKEELYERFIMLERLEYILSDLVNQYDQQQKLDNAVYERAKKLSSTTLVTDAYNVMDKISK